MKSSKIKLSKADKASLVLIFTISFFLFADQNLMGQLKINFF
jgi:hypothetical protein